jgi:hypothetical protein
MRSSTPMADSVPPRDALRSLVDWFEAFDRAIHGPNPGGAPAGTGLTLAALVAKTAELEELDGGPPTQAAVAAALGLSVERVRQVGRPAGGWQGVIARAADRKPRDEVESRFTTGSLPSAGPMTGQRSERAG